MLYRCWEAFAHTNVQLLYTAYFRVFTLVPTVFFFCNVSRVKICKRRILCKTYLHVNLKYVCVCTPTRSYLRVICEDAGGMQMCAYFRVSAISAVCMYMYDHMCLVST